MIKIGNKNGDKLYNGIDLGYDVNCIKTDSEITLYPLLFWYGPECFYNIYGIRGDGNDMCIAETIYYYAMKKPFYNPPLTYQVKELLAGRGETYLKMMNYVKSIQK